MRPIGERISGNASKEGIRRKEKRKGPIQILCHLHLFIQAEPPRKAGGLTNCIQAGPDHS